MTVAKDTAPTARRIDRDRGISEEATFFDNGSHRLFGVLHRPTGPAVGGLVVCPSIHAEFIKRYRMDVSLARALASRGIAVQRFHYFGTGHSDGEADETSFATMRADALAAAERLLEQADVEGLAFLGTRFGGLVAASAASEHPKSSLLLVEPTLEAGRFFRDAWRAQLMRDVAGGVTPSNRGLADALAVESTVDVLGYEICRSLFESATGRALVTELGKGARRVLFVQLGRSTSVRGDAETGAAALRELGCDVDVAVVPDDVAWWFIAGSETKQARGHALVEVASDWLEREFAGG